MATKPNTNTDAAKTRKKDVTRAPRRVRKTDTPAPADVAAESASIYPDTVDAPPTADEIAAEAYAIYQERGGMHGRHEEDWLEAERRVSARRKLR